MVTIEVGHQVPGPGIKCPHQNSACLLPVPRCHQPPLGPEQTAWAWHPVSCEEAPYNLAWATRPDLPRDVPGTMEPTGRAWPSPTLNPRALSI